jgi:hypothetical protein
VASRHPVPAGRSVAQPLPRVGLSTPARGGVRVFGDHNSRSERLLWGVQLVAGLGSQSPQKAWGGGVSGFRFPPPLPQLPVKARVPLRVVGAFREANVSCGATDSWRAWGAKFAVESPADWSFAVGVSLELGPWDLELPPSPVPSSSR